MLWGVGAAAAAAAVVAAAIPDIKPLCIPLRIKIPVIWGLPSKKPGVLIPKSPNSP